MKRKSKWLLAVAALYAGARLWRLTASCLWFDEIFGVHAARQAWGEMLRFVAADLIHPPLFYVLLKVWMALGGESLAWLRLLPALVAVACIAPFLLLCRELHLSHRETTLALLLLAASGYLIKYAQEVRMYSLLLLLTLTSLWLFARFVTRGDGAGPHRRLLVALCAANLLLVYTHYYGWLVVAAEAVYLLVFARRKFRPFALVVCVLVACFAPWAYAVGHAAREGAASLQQNLGWAARPGLSDPARFLLLVNEPFYFRQSSAESASALLSAPLALLLFFAPIAALLRRTLSRKRRESDAARTEHGNDDDATRRPFDGDRRTLAWLVVMTLLPLAVAFAASRLLPQSVWGTRHLVIVAAPYLMLSAVALTRLRPVWLRTAAHAALVVWLCVAALVVAVRREPPYIWCAWEELAAQLAREEPAASAGSIRVYALEDLVAYHLWFAFDTARDRRFEVAVVKRLPGATEDPAYFLPRRFDGVRVRDASEAFNENQFWVAFRDAELSEQRQPLKTLKERGFRMAQIRESGFAGQRAFLILWRRD